MALQSATLKACFSKAAEGAQIALERSIADAIASLQIAEMQTSKGIDSDLLRTAGKGLADFKSAWVDGYKRHLAAEFNATKNDSLSREVGGATTVLESAPSSTNTLTSAGSLANALGAHPAELSLVDDHQISQAIESARLLQQMLPHLEQSLLELNSLISSAQGLTRVQPELNPLRPEIFATCLLDLLYGVAAPPAVTALWIKNLGSPLGRELSSVYDSVVNLLQLADVQGAIYQVVQTVSERGKSSARFSTPKQSFTGAADQVEFEALRTHASGRGNLSSSDQRQFDPASEQDGLSLPLVTAALFEDFLLQGGTQSEQKLAPAYRKRLQDEFVALSNADIGSTLSNDTKTNLPGTSTGQNQGLYWADTVLVTDAGAPSLAYHRLPAVDRPRRDVTEETDLNSRFWGTYAQPHARAVARSRLKAEANDMHQVMGLEVVRQLVHEVAQDARLLAPVREAIVALEPALGRLAMQDPRFFSQETHPGRLLLEGLTQRSLKFNDEFSPEFSVFFEPVKQIVNALNGEGVIDVCRFETALSALRNEWAIQDKTEASRRHEMLEKMRFAENRQTHADRISHELSMRSDLEGVPDFVLDFLFGYWSLAIAHARLSDTQNQLDPEGFQSAVPDLVWSSKPQVATKQPAKFIEMIPGLLSKLHYGLRMLGTDANECASFFEGLMKLHQPLLLLRRLKSQRDVQESSSALLSGAASLTDDLTNSGNAAAAAEQPRAKVAAMPWMGKNELLNAGFQHTNSADFDMLTTEEGPSGEGRPETEPTFQQNQANQLPDSDIANDAFTSDTAAPLRDAPVALVVPAVDKDDSYNPPPSVLLDSDVGGDAVTSDTAVPPGDALVAPAVDEGGFDTTPPCALPAAETILQALRAGDWVDLYSHRRWLRAQLTWASSKGTLFMFISHGGQPHSMTKRSCERLIAGRFLRPVESHGVVSHALQAVAANAKAVPLGRAVVPA